MITMLKLGGSLITDKNHAHTANMDVIKRLGYEILSVWENEPFPLILGHGSGSFGHIPAKKYGTRSGVRTEEEWAGFAEVHAEATALNRIVTDILRGSGLPVISFVPMDSIRAADGRVTFWDTAVIRDCIRRGLIPLIFGDTVFDSVRGGTILSTEDLFVHLGKTLEEPPRILLAGLEAGVWADYPKNTLLIPVIRAEGPDADVAIKGSEFPDVTGGMKEKVHLMQELIQNGQADSAVIFSGAAENELVHVLNNEPAGTLIIS